MKKLEVLREMFSKCGNGVRVMRMSDVNEKDRFRIYRKCDLGNRVNWVKCKKILNGNNINYSEGDSGWGMMLSRCIDFEF